MVVYAVSMVNKVEDNLKPEENATSLVEEIQTLEEYKGDVVNILVCGIDYEEGRAYSSDGSNDGMTDMILYCQFDIKGGALRMLQIPRNSLVATQNRKITLSNGKTYAATNYQINSVALSNGGDIAALAEVIYDQYKLPIDYYVTIDMQALVEMVDELRRHRGVYPPRYVLCGQCPEAGLPQPGRRIGRILCPLPATARRTPNSDHRPPEHAALFRMPACSSGYAAWA